ncbi:helix-turn-helix domain-containing protein [Rhizobium paknamense]|uniref:CRP/FNR family transcriptional regulator n=1 Tax=Rhizobium paknamense TaxID=1206817 RepID=A0ABU0I9C6_9HYPH|nr:helix-turn-helix domain-containing protein [Rhizobium paknamense]MDQ0454070.1 CRP/FNR family transcriptional regulator [Rhizobium paknamense]
MTKDATIAVAADAPSSCRACNSRLSGLCATLSIEELVGLSRYSARRRLEPGEEIIGQGEMILTCGNILNGVIKLSKMTADGRQQIVGLQFAPHFLGRLFAEQSGLTAEAAVESYVCSFPRTAVHKVLGDNPDFERKLHEQSLAELDQAQEWMLTLGRKSALEKVASFLVLVATEIDQRESFSTSFDLPLTRLDIADFLGLTIETVSRQLTKLRKEKIITLSGTRHVNISAPKQLMRLADNGDYLK